MRDQITKDILNYKLAYQTIGLEPPPYRITCEEHKSLYESCKSLLPKDWKPCMMSEYYGVKIEVVMLVDDYL